MKYYYFSSPLSLIKGAEIDNKTDTLNYILLKVFNISKS